MPGADDDPVPPRGGGDESEPFRERHASLPDEPAPGAKPALPPPPAPSVDPAPPRGDPEAPHRPSLLDELRVSRTTLHEVGKVARRLSLMPLGLAESRRLVRQLVLSGLFGLLLTLGVALIFAGGTLRLLAGILAGTCIAALGLFFTLRAVGKLADRFGARLLPGSPWLWVGAVMLLALAGTFGVSYSLWEVTKLPQLGPPPPPAPVVMPLPSAPVEADRADLGMKRGLHVGLPRGVLYAPPEFASRDGRFDLVIHFHGAVELIEQGVAATQLNALVAIINVGDGSGPYLKEMQSPYAFDRLLTTIEERARERLLLKRAEIRRIALSAWSAGFASVNEILGSRSRFDRVDAVFLLDSPHAKYAPHSTTQVYRPSIAHYVAFARRAMAGEKLMIITHSAIETEGYPSTTETTNAVLNELSLERQPVTSEAAWPPAVTLPAALRAFPSGERNWLNVVDQVKERDFAVYGCTGNGKGDHIAHLAQMSVTVLPALRERWK